MLLGHAQKVFEPSKLYSVEFRVIPNSKTMSINFWDGAHLVQMEICSIPGDMPVVKGKLNLVSQLQSAVGTGAQKLGCGGRNADVLKALDQDPERHAGIQYAFC